MTAHARTQRLSSSFLTAIVVAGSPAAGQDNQIDDAAKPELTVTADPRIELLATVQALSGYAGRTKLITRYDHP